MPRKLFRGIAIYLITCYGVIDPFLMCRVGFVCVTFGRSYYLQLALGTALLDRAKYTLDRVGGMWHCVLMKTCIVCHIEKPITDFWKKGPGRTRGDCKECGRKKENTKKRHRPNRKPKIINTIKERARGRLRDAVRYGKIKKPDACEFCLLPKEKRHLQGHHHKGYDYPLDVIWLCGLCHAKEHRA